MKIILSGGGTLGSVSPLIAIWQEIDRKYKNVEYVWVGTKNGPEQKLVSSYKIPYIAISSGKLRRYFSINNFFDPFLIIAGFFQSIILILKSKPKVIISAGGFVSVPLIWAGWLLQVPILIHQQDVRPGLANKLSAPFAKIITTTFAESLNDFSANKTVLTGNPARRDIILKDQKTSFEYFDFDKNIPVVLIIGGGTGAAKINQLVFDSLQELVSFCQVIHLTGEGKNSVVAEHPRYRAYEFLTKELGYVFAITNIVVTRAGMSTLTELSILNKPMIIIPIPYSHQEDNAILFGKNNAAVILDEKSLDKNKFINSIKELINDNAYQLNLARNASKLLPPNAAEKVVDYVVSLVK